MKQHQLVATRRFPAPWLLILAVVCLPSLLSTDETEPSGFPTLNWGATVEEVQLNLGPPAFAAQSILMYSTAVVTGAGTAAADLTLWFQADRLFFASYAFRADGISADGLTADFESISEQLRLAFDQPSSRATEPGSFTTEVWNLDEIDIEHTLILDPGRVDHVVNFTVARPRQ